MYIRKIVLPFILITLAVISFSCQIKRQKNGIFWVVRSHTEIQCETYRNGKLIKIITFLRDSITKSGRFYEFGANGDTLKKGYFRDNKLIGSYYEFYYQNHPKKYFCFDSFNEDTMYCRIYDSSGMILRQWDDVDLFYNRSYTIPKTITLNKDSLFEIWSVIVEPPKTKFSVRCIMMRLGGRDSIQPFKSYFLPNQNKLIYVTVFKINQNGKYDVYVYSTLIDSSRRESLNRTQRFVFNFPI